MLSSPPINGRLNEYSGVAPLRQATNATPDLVLKLLAAHRELGVQAARLVWKKANEVLRSVAVAQLLAK
ncbi:hypothetical protein [Kitasatospora sp. NPDC088779]|uniref:hypothetical protein n=1 Tax=Kitasatospora sp. NPDC088779 TaxID=3154964 RepID=UPI00343D4BFF